MAPHWTIIHNPKSCSGKSAKLWPEIAQLLARSEISYTLHTTLYARHAIDLTRDAILAGARHLVAVGGDGTVNEVLNGIFGQSVVPTDQIVMTQIPIGTGNDWRRTVGIPTKYAACIAMLKDPMERLQDVGVVAWDAEAGTQQRYFCNVAGMGFEAAVGVKANADKAAGKGGILGYIPALLGILFRYQATSVAFKIDGKALPQRKFFTMAVGICKFNGGGMKQCPDAVIDDGLFDLTFINEVPKSIVVANFPRIFTGGFVKIKYVEQHRGKSIEVITGPETLLEVDGENIGQGAASFSILPVALRVAVPQA
jgi:diacylglycerol kinase (ATP)